MQLFNSKLEALLFGDVDDDEDVSTIEGDFPPDTLDRIDCESSDTVFGLCVWIVATLCIFVTTPVIFVCSWFISSKDSFVRSDTRRFFIGD